ncbi:MAG: choice-of-anchor J domain-containing protein [bacterium]|nr:choice-of-anchor J domain-containing protein [bacterium]
MYALFVAFLFCALASVSLADVVHHSLLRVYGKTEAHEKALLRDDRFDVLPPDDQPGQLIAALPEDFARLSADDYHWDLIHQDLEEYYARRARDGGALDLMGGFKTHSEILAAMDTIHANHPGITTARFVVGTTIEGRDIHAIKISDNPDVDENEIELLYNSLIHAREPGAMEVLFLFMETLTEQYGVDAAVTDLVDNREFYFIPCMNVDGYLYNQQTNPNGGGMWRKNRRSNADGSVGVDLNRNWGYNWGYDNNGSSPTPSSLTYRGTGPFSEPETASIRDFINSREFIVAMNYHTYSNLILYPWGVSSWQGGFTPEDGTFQLMADSMQFLIEQVNGATYTIGPPWQILYDVNGDCNDWCYGEQTSKGRIFSFTTEVGGDFDGFWPEPNRIQPLAEENLPANFFVARYAQFLVPPDFQVRRVTQWQTEQNGNGDGTVDPGEQVALEIYLRNTGFQDLTGITGTFTTTTPNVSVIAGTASWGSLAHQDSAANSSALVLAVGAGFNAPGAVVGNLHVTSTEGLDTNFAITAVVGRPVFFDNLEGGGAGWTHTGDQDQWHVSARRAESPTHSWYCGLEAAGQYSSNQNAVLISPPILLGNNSVLTFSHFYQLESGADFGFVEIDAGNGAQMVAGPYSGATGTWQTVSVPLSQFAAGSTIHVRFRQTSDGSLVQEGWYLDDIFIGPSPEIAIEPTAIAADVDTFGTSNEPLTVSNNGGSDLVYSVVFQQPQDSTDRGGPDAAGYIWQDSQDECPPVYSWLPISTLGTQLTWLDGEGDQTRGPFTLPFSFPFYGQMYSQMFVSGNGWISFTDEFNELAINERLPSVNAAAAAIFAWWDDLKPQLAGTNVRYWDNGSDSAAVHFENVRAGTTPNQGTYNFQILLTARGEARVMYGNMGTIRLASATVGIQNPDKNIGLTVLHNQTGVANFEARRFALGPRWVSVLPLNGVIAPGERDTLFLSLLGRELCGDPSSATLLIRSNDVNTPELTVPITATPAAALAAPTAFTVYPDGNDLVFQWNAVPGASRYYVEYLFEMGGLPTIVGMPTTNSFTHVNALNLSTGFYQVRALP